MSRLALILAFCLPLLFCDDDAPTSNPVCQGPTITSCTGDPCAFAHIYDSDSNFVSESEYNPMYSGLLWNGTDCVGNDVPCGEYAARITVLSGGQPMRSVVLVLVANGASGTATGIWSCDSLGSACAGTYHETVNQTGWGTTEVGCICCP
ncbi:MAG: hypothetical protein GF331_14910 [Chitinivibrionales bacterium]|nr:hypothetical protein [Chitinivibrionales bacterium]